jgi:hypothetical protein
METNTPEDIRSKLLEETFSQIYLCMEWRCYNVPVFRKKKELTVIYCKPVQFLKESHHLLVYLFIYSLQNNILREKN